MLPLFSASAQLCLRDFVLLHPEFVREIEKILPVTAIPLFWSPQGIDDLAGKEGMAADVEDRLQEICAGGEPARVDNLLVLPLSVANGGPLAVVLQGIDPGLSEKMAQEWLAEISEQLRANLEGIKQAHVHPETGLYTSRLLYSRLTRGAQLPTSLLLVGAAHRGGTASTGLRQLVLSARLLESAIEGAVFYLGGNLFAVMQDNIDREAAFHGARRLLVRLKREGLHSVHIGIAVRGEAGVGGERGDWFAECWQALEAAERRGPFSLCESSTLWKEQADPLDRPDEEVMRRLQRAWRGQPQFGLLLYRMDVAGKGASLDTLLTKHSAGRGMLVPVSGNEVYVLLPGASQEEAIACGRELKTKVDSRAGDRQVALGISAWPCLGYSKGETAVNCRKALLHGGFLGPGALTVFDHLSLNVSGDHAFDEGDYRGAVRDYRAGLRLNPDDINLMNSLGVALAELNRQREAVGAFDRVLASEPGNFMALVNKGFALRMLGRQAEALSCFEQVARRPGFKRSEAFADISLQLGRLYCAAGNYRKALPVLERLAQAGPDLQGFHLYRLMGEAYAGVGKNEEAMQALQRAIRLNPHDAQSLSILGDLYAREGQGDEIGLSFCLRAVTLDDKAGKHWYRLARVQEKMGKTGEALAAVRQSLRRNRRDTDTLLLAGRLYLRSGNTRRAQATYQRIEQMVPGQREAVKALRALSTEKQTRKG